MIDESEDRKRRWEGEAFFWFVYVVCVSTYILLYLLYLTSSFILCLINVSWLVGTVVVVVS